MRLTETAIRRPVTTLMVFVCFVVFGVVATRLIPLEYFPEVDDPAIDINLPYPGSTPAEVEEQVTRIAEEALATISGVKRMTSWTNEGGANITLFFDWGEEVSLQAIKAREKLDGVRHLFPSDFERYYVNQSSTADRPVLNLRISSDRDLSNAYELLNRKLIRRLERLEGVSNAELNGVVQKEIRIELIADRIAAHRIDLGALSQQLQQANFSVTAGRVTDAGRRFIVRPVGMLQSVDQVRALPINAQGLRLGDIAHVVHDDPRLDYGRHLDGDFAISVEVQKSAEANTVEVADRIFEELELLRDDPEMTGINIYEMDNAAAGIVQSLNDLLESGMLGAVFAFIILFLFLRRVTTTLIVALAVPVSIVVTVGVLYFAGISLNVLTMMGLMLAIGMLVDNAVVVTESIHRHQMMGADRVQATIAGVREVGVAVTAGTLTTGIVFLPAIISPADEVTLYLKHVSITICVALAASLLIAMTVVPLLTSRLSFGSEPPKTQWIEWLVDRYVRLLGWLLRRKGIAALFVLAILASVAIPVSLVNSDFFPDENNERRVMLHYHVNGTYQLERVEEAVDEIEAYLFANKESFGLESVYSWYTTNTAQSTLILKDEDETDLTLDAVKDRVAENLPKLAIAHPNFTWRSNNPARGATMRVTVSGESSEQLAEISQDIADMLNRVEGFEDVVSEAQRGAGEVHIRVDRARARQYGFTTQSVAQSVSAAMRGQNLRRFQTEDGEIAMRLEFQGADQQTVDQLRNLSLANEQNDRISLAALADLQTKRGPRGIFRENRITLMGVQVPLNDLTRDEAQDKVAALMENYALPPGYAWSFGFGSQRAEESESIMLTNLLIALVLIYLVMAALFESLIHPAAIWTSIIFAIIGVYWFFLITGTTFSVMAWIGVLILVGIVVNNGIVLIDHINHLRAEGYDRDQAILEGGRDRLRPILMTAATTVLGLIPLCITNTLIGGDGPPYYPMARAIVGGLTFSTVVSLLVLPTIYIFLDDLRTWGRVLADHVRHGEIPTKPPFAGTPGP